MPTDGDGQPSGSNPAFVMLRQPSGDFIDGSGMQFPPNEKQYRVLWFHEEGDQVLHEHGEYQPALSLYGPNKDANRTVETIACLPTIRENQLFHLLPRFREDVLKGFVGPFDKDTHINDITGCLLDVSKRIPSPMNNTGASYADEDFAISVSYKQRSRKECGGTLTETDARIIAAGIRNISQDVNRRRVWVWFDQMLSQNVPDVNSSEWYRFGALPYLVLPVFKYVHEDMLGETFRPWLVFEDTASLHCAGFWCTKNGLMSAYPSRSGRYERILGGVDVVAPGMMLRWRAGLSHVITSLHENERDRLLVTYDFADSFRHFISWATHLISGQRVPEDEKLPWFYRIERSFACLLDHAEPTDMNDTAQWSLEHIMLKESVQNEARKLLVEDGNHGDYLIPTSSNSGLVGVRMYDGEVIVKEDDELKVITAQKCCDDMLQLMTSSANSFSWSESSWPGSGRIYDPETKQLSLHIMRYNGTLMYLIGALEELITELASASPVICPPPSAYDHSCYESFLALQRMSPSVWHFPVLYIENGERRLLQVELLLRNILNFGGAIKLQAEILWRLAESSFKVISQKETVHQARETRHIVSEPGETWDEDELPLPVHGCIGSDGSHAAKAMLGILSPEEIPHEKSSYSLVYGAGRFETFVDIAEMKLHESGEEGIFVCGVNNLSCTLHKADEEECAWVISWGEQSDVPAHELAPASISGRVR